MTLLIVVILLPTSQVYSYQPQYREMHTLGGSGYDYGVRIYVARSGCKYIVGTTYRFDEMNYDVYIAKVSKDGVILWDGLWGKTLSEYPYDSVVDKWGNLYVVGYPGFIIKVDREGNLQWSYYLNYEYENYFLGVTLDKRGKIYAVGYIWTGEGYSIILVKLDRSGRRIWSRIIGSEEMYEYINWLDIAFDRYSNSIYVVGSFTISSLDVVRLIKLSRKGEIIWSKELNMGEGNYLYVGGVVTDRCGNVIVVGELYVNRDRGYDIYVTKFDKNGDIMWSRIWGGTGSDYVSFFWPTASTILTDNKGNIYVSGTHNIGPGKYNAIIFKLSRDGRLLWDRMFDSPTKRTSGAGLFVRGRRIYLLGTYMSYQASYENAEVTIIDPDIYLVTPDAEAYPIEMYSLNSNIGLSYLDADIDHAYGAMDNPHYSELLIIYMKEG